MFSHGESRSSAIVGAGGEESIVPRQITELIFQSERLSRKSAERISPRRPAFPGFEKMVVIFRAVSSTRESNSGFTPS